MPIIDFLQGLQVENLFQSFFLPFVLTFVIFWGLLEALRVFNRRINLVLALGITIAAGYGGLFAWLSSYMLTLGAYVGLAAFVIIFIVGAIVWALGRGEEIISPGRRAAKIREEIEKLYDKASRTNNESKRRAYLERARRLEMEYEVAIRRERR